VELSKTIISTLPGYTKLICDFLRPCWFIFPYNPEDILIRMFRLKFTSFVSVPITHASHVTTLDIQRSVLIHAPQAFITMCYIAYGREAKSTGPLECRNGPSARDTRTGLLTVRDLPMEQSTIQSKDGTGIDIDTALSQIDAQKIGDSTRNCAACGSRLEEGDAVTCCAFKPIDGSTYRINYVHCGHTRHGSSHAFQECYSELIITGRVGRCSDVRTQRSWLVLLEPRPDVVSPAGTTASREVTPADASQSAQSNWPTISVDDALAGVVERSRRSNTTHREDTQ